MDPSKTLRIPLSPRARRIAAAATLGAGVLLVGRVLTPQVPREVDVRVRLGAFREPPAVARGLSLTFARDGDAVRSLSVRFARPPPLEWHASLALPPGDYRAEVTVELDGRAVRRESPVRVEPGATIRVPAPRQP